MITTDKPSIGLACAGGAIEGAAYEIGALCALDETLEGVDFSQLNVYVGVSSGAFIASCLANQITPDTLRKAIISTAEAVLPITPETFFTPAYKEYRKRLLKIPSLVNDSIWDYLSRPFDISLTGSLFRLTSALPIGLFDNENIRSYLADNFSLNGRTDDFRELDTKLRVIATQLTSGKIYRFGESPHDDVKISKAVQASTALPSLYMPVEIGGEHFIDGVARRTVHASSAFEEGAELLFCINPIVPITEKQRKKIEEKVDESIVEQGLPNILSQTFRLMISSRMRAGFKNYEHEYPDADYFVFEPDSNSVQTFFTNIFSFENRQNVCEFGYKTTRKQLRERVEKMKPVLSKYGITVREDILFEERELYPDLPVHKQSKRLKKRKKTKQIDQILNRLDDILDDVEPNGNGENGEVTKENLEKVAKKEPALSYA